MLLKATYRFLTFLIVAFLLHACSGVLFDEKMPRSAKEITELPSELEGSYISIEYTHDRLNASFYRIERPNSQKAVIYHKTNSYLDSTNLGKQKITQIDSAYFLPEKNKLCAISGANKIELRLNDSLPNGETEEHYATLDLASPNIIIGKDSSACEIRTQNEKFYLNIQYGTRPQVYIIRAELNKSTLTLNNSMDWRKNDPAALSQLIKKYGLIIAKEGNKDFALENYSASIPDAQLDALLDEKSVFNTRIWHKLGQNPKKKEALLPALLVFVAALVIWIVYKRRKSIPS